MPNNLNATRGADNCTWSRACHPTIATPERDPCDISWVCVRLPDARRSVTDGTCSDCGRWERFDEPENYLW